MDFQRTGRILRALRRRRAWTQADLAVRSGVSQSAVSRVERGHVGATSVDSVSRLFATLDAMLTLDVRWRGGALDRLLDERHAALAGAVARVLAGSGWTVQPEVTYSHFGERGSIDLLASHPSGAILVIEIKTELVSVEQTLRKLDEKVRLVPIIAGQPKGPVGRVVVLLDNTTQRERVTRHAPVLDAALPHRSVAVKQWLHEPVGPLRGLWFFRISPTRNGAEGNRRNHVGSGVRPRSAKGRSSR